MPALRRLLLPLGAVVCYITAFFLPTLYLVGQANTLGEHTWMVGAVTFIDGFFAMFDRQYAWMANPLAVVALILLLCRVYLASLPLALAALAVAQHTWA